MSDFKVETLFLNEELTDGEIDSLEVGNALIDASANTYVVKSVHRDDTGDVVLIKLRTYEAPEAEGEEGEELTIRMTAQELKKFDLA